MKTKNLLSFRADICGPGSITSESRRAFLKNSISLALAGFTYSALPSIALANSLNSSVNTSNLLKSNLIAYKGYIYDSTVMAYRLGKRHYNPFKKSFNTPDSLSPFGLAGQNRYQYADGNPVNRVDPGGHMSGEAFAMIVFISAMVVLTSIVTFGAAAIAFGGALTVGSIVTGSLLIASGVTGIASAGCTIGSIALEESNPELSQQLNMAGLGLGIISMITGVAGFSVGVSGTATAGTFGRIFSSTSQTSMMSKVVVNQMVNAARATKMAGGLSDGFVAMGQVVVGYMAKNGTNLLKIGASSIAGGLGTVGVAPLRRHYNNIEAHQRHELNINSKSVYILP
ncbi:RHS repeat-associated core domain-containing protein [Shewanella sp. S23-S33]|uniref:RHS repeat-associated core domain-containing protein n=1 Tax=Shewanella sp. S23-S33 TaxID=3342769 RepID=UPI00372CFF23